MPDAAVAAQPTQGFDVIVAGAGIAGSAVAGGLAADGYRVALVDPGQRVSTPADPVDLADVDQRVSALSPASVHLLDTLGVWSRIDDPFRAPYRHMRVWDADGTGSIHFSAAEVRLAALGYIVENSRLLAALHQGLDSSHGVQWFTGQSVAAIAGDGLVRLSGGDVLSAPLLLGADGARSRVRDLAGISYHEEDCAQQAIVATIHCERSHRDTAWQRFLPAGPLALLPLGVPADRRHCSIVWSADVEVAERLLAMNDAMFSDALSVASEHCLGKILAVSRRQAFPLWQRHARQYTAPGIALLADAAHSIHPLAGQGINLGIADVTVLLDELRRARRRQLAPGDLTVLSRYQRRRLGQNKLMLQSMHGFQWLFGSRGMPQRLVRNMGLNAVAGAAPLKRLFMHEALGLH